MFTYRNSEIIDCVVDVMMPYANEPNIRICLKDKIKDQPPQEKIYTRAADGCYFYQGEDGETDYIYHARPIKQIGTHTDGLPIYETTENLNGFGGDTYTLKVKLDQGLAWVRLLGPWSGGCYCANEHLPKPAMEVSVSSPDYGCMVCGNMSIEKLQPVLDKFQPGWRIVACDDNSFDMIMQISEGPNKQYRNVARSSGEQAAIIHPETSVFPIVVYQNKTKGIWRETPEGKAWLEKLSKEANQKLMYWTDRRDQERYREREKQWTLKKN
jgi:hypothetical protein